MIKKSVIVALAIFLAAVAFFVVKSTMVNQANPSADGERKIEIGSKELDSQQLVADLVDSEVLLREVKPILKKIGRSIGNLKFPDTQTQSLFAKDFEFKQQASGGQFADVLGWPELFENVSYFENSTFTPARVTDRSDLPNAFRTYVIFEALARMTDGTWKMFETSGEIQWQKSDGWLVKSMELKPFVTQSSKELLFEDQTLQLLGTSVSKRLRQSKHYDIVVQVTKTGNAAFPNPKAAKYSQHIPTGQHPALVVVDIDNDGWDDIYLVEQWRPNVLLRNRGDGTFEDATEQFQLGIEGHCSSAIFADFDNDGDKDLMLGRSLNKSLFFENDDGLFLDASDTWFEPGFPSLVTSISATDYNNDGLLDLYLSTYGFPSGKFPPEVWLSEFLDPEAADNLLWQFQAGGNNRYLSALGPPNLLLENKGGRFEVSEHDKQLQLNLNSFQSTWCDFDGDSDPDLYISNDFAQDFLFQNDGDDGFSNVTLSVGDETMMGFGMGATWGDYDADGRPDLYVSNMYSKAGLRIVEQFDDLDPRFRRSADGNRLYRNTEDGFELVSANESEGLNVHKAGWSWGGQFLDVDNDRFQDIYVVSGYFSAPPSLASNKDL